MDWLTDQKLPIGAWAKSAVDWLIENAGFVFDWLSVILKSMIDGLLWLLELPHPLLFTALVVALAWWLKRSIPLGVFVALSLLFIINQGYWDDMIKTLALVIASAVVCMVLGLPLAIMPIRAMVTHFADWSMVMVEKKLGVPSAATQARSISPPSTLR